MTTMLRDQIIIGMALFVPLTLLARTGRSFWKERQQSERAANAAKLAMAEELASRRRAVEAPQRLSRSA